MSAVNALQSCISRASAYPEDKLFDAKMSFLSDIRKHDSLKHVCDNPLTFVIINSATTKSELIETMKDLNV